MPGHFDFLHVKKNSAGSPNELSLDVLDAARSQLDGNKSRRSRGALSAGPNQGSYHGVGGSSTLSAVPEVERRKKARRANAVRLGVLVGLLLVVAGGAIGYYGWTNYQARVDYESRFDFMLNHLSNIDAQIVEIDQIMAGSVVATGAETRSRLEREIPEMLKKLEASREEAQSLESRATRDEDEVALSRVSATIDGREDMLIAASSSLKLVDTLENDSSEATKLWARVIEADQMAREATSAANKAASEEAIESAKQQTQQALAEFSEAKELLAGANSDLSRADFSKQQRYLGKRIESLEHAVATADALLAGDKDKASRENDAYNEADKDAASLAEELPLTLENQVRSLFTDELASLRADYFEARDRVSEADADIREYAGR